MERRVGSQGDWGSCSLRCPSQPVCWGDFVGFIGIEMLQSPSQGLAETQL